MDDIDRYMREREREIKHHDVTGCYSLFQGFPEENTFTWKLAPKGSLQKENPLSLLKEVFLLVQSNE